MCKRDVMNIQHSVVHMYDIRSDMDGLVSPDCEKYTPSPMRR